jgi:hypothetical protein
MMKRMLGLFFTSATYEKSVSDASVVRLVYTIWCGRGNSGEPFTVIREENAA